MWARVGENLMKVVTEVKPVDLLFEFLIPEGPVHNPLTETHETRDAFETLVWGFPNNSTGVPHSKDRIILGSILGSPCFGKLPYQPQILNRTCSDQRGIVPLLPQLPMVISSGTDFSLLHSFM